MNQQKDIIRDARVLGTPKMLLLGLQHMFAMFGATILVPILVNSYFQSTSQVLSVQVTLFCAGFGTLFFHLCTKFKVPAFLGSSFAFLGGFSSVAALDTGIFANMADKEKLQYACGGIVVAGLLYLILALIIRCVGVKRVMRFLPPVVTGPIIICIGLSLAPSAVSNASTNWLIAIVALAVIIIFNIWGKGMFKIIPILMGVVIAYAVAVVLNALGIKNPDGSVIINFVPVAQAGIVRTHDLKTWERLDNLKTLRSPQQRNVVLHPEFVDGKYAFYTRPMDDFIDTGSGSGIGFGLCDDITHAVIDEEKMTSIRKYHTITEAKNGAGATPIRTDRGWIHIAHGVRNTAAGLRYVIYAFATDLNDPSKVIAEPSGLLIGPRGEERVGDVSNVVFTNGAIVNDKNEVFIYYASSDTRMHVATTTIDRLIDYVFNTPQDPGRSVLCVQQRCDLIKKNLEYLKNHK